MNLIDRCMRDNRFDLDFCAPRVSLWFQNSAEKEVPYGRVRGANQTLCVKMHTFDFVYMFTGRDCVPGKCISVESGVTRGTSA